MTFNVKMPKFAFTLRQHAYAIYMYCDFHCCKNDDFLTKICDIFFCICKIVGTGLNNEAVSNKYPLSIFKSKYVHVRTFRRF